VDKDIKRRGASAPILKRNSGLKPGCFSIVSPGLKTGAIKYLLSFLSTQTPVWVTLYFHSE